MSSSFNKLFQFNGINAFILNVNGIIYGVTNFGGLDYQEGNDFSGYGTLFRYNPSNGDFNTLYEFDGYNGYVPNYLIEINGILYGTTLTGGIGFVDGNIFSGNGTVFSYNLNNGNFNSIFQFSGGDNGYIPLFFDKF